MYGGRCPAADPTQGCTHRLQVLTVLLPLSPKADNFEGGGTGFWSQESGGPGVAAEPSLVLTPPAGTALLYGGSTPHSGMRVTAGCRAIFLASFSARRVDLELWG